MTLAERIHVRMIADPTTRRRLDGIPPAVIEDVLRLGFEALENAVPMHARASELSSTEWSACEVCGHLIDGAEPEGAVCDSEGVWVCDACKDEETTR